MARHSPLLQSHRDRNALLAPYGPDGSDVMLVQAFGPVPLEYASVRTFAGISDEPNRATITVAGDDRLSFLNRMLTQELSVAKGFAPYTMRPSFWLNRKGRIDADLRVIHLPDRVILDTDVFAAERVREGLESYVITEDVRLTDDTETRHRLSLHGPAAAAILDRASTHVAGSHVLNMPQRHAGVVVIGGAEVLVVRDDVCGEIGMHLLVPTAHAAGVFEALADHTPMPEAAAERRPPSKARPAGWQALNIARIEAGSPLYYADFGPDSLPAETGVLRDRVSFTKGCYLGQEVVARMDALGHPKQRLVALRVSEAPAHASSPSPGLQDASAPADAYCQQAVTGTAVLAADAPDAPVVGAVTSSCVSPMLGDAPIAFAMVKWASSEPGTELFLQLDGVRARAKVNDGLALWLR